MSFFIGWLLGLICGITSKTIVTQRQQMTAEDVFGNDPSNPLNVK